MAQKFPDFMTTAQDGGKVVSLTHRPPLPPENTTWYSFLLEAESTPGPQCDRKDYYYYYYYYWYYWYSALGPVWAETRAQSGD